MNQGRLEDAETCFLGELSRDPENDFIHSRLAICRMQQDGRKNDALESVEEAIRLRSDEDYYHGLRSLILSDLHRPKEALDAADQAISMNPESSFHFAAKASAYVELNRWADAEENCRKALAIDPDDTMAEHILTNVLRLQGKSDESRRAADAQLADDPESSLAHHNAGWAALQCRDHERAEEHFREALRLDPEMEGARDGLLESFKARSWFYRIYLSYSFFMQRFTGGKQFVIIIGALLAYQALRIPLRQLGKPFEFVLIGLWLTLVLWIWLAPGIGNFLVLLDNSARHALKKSEALLGFWIGISLIAGIPFLAAGILGQINVLTPLGAMLIASTIPATLTFGNRSRKGTMVFGGVLGLILLCGIMSALLRAVSPGGAQSLSEIFLAVLIAASILCTWLGNIPALRRDDSEALPVN